MTLIHTLAIGSVGRGNIDNLSVSHEISDCSYPILLHLFSSPEPKARGEQL